MTREILDLIIAAGEQLGAHRNEMARDVADRLDRTLESPPEVLRGEASWVPACGVLALLVGGQSGQRDPLLRAVAASGGKLPWLAAPRELCPDTFADGHAFVELFGPDGMVPGEGVRMGLFLLGPRVFYPSHAHGAEELYLVLAGAGDWQRSGLAFEAKGPEDLIHHAPLELHALKTGQSGLLTLWAWRGEIGFESYRYV